MTMLLKPPDPRGTLAKDKHVLTQYYTAAEGDTTLTITLPAPGLDWYYPAPMPSWNTEFWLRLAIADGMCTRLHEPLPRWRR